MFFNWPFAGLLGNHTSSLEYKAKDFEKVMNVNVNGVLYTAQAAGRQSKHWFCIHCATLANPPIVDRFKIPGSIIMIASMSGSITNRV